jgi:hypothetical protein
MTGFQGNVPKRCADNGQCVQQNKLAVRGATSDRLEILRLLTPLKGRRVID